MGPLLHPSSQPPHLFAVTHSAHVTMASSALTLMLVFACLIAASQAFYGGYGLMGMGMGYGIGYGMPYGMGMMGGYGLGFGYGMPMYGGYGYGLGMYGRYY